MPNKTIYVSEDDLALYQRAQELAGGTLSAAITAALRRFVEAEEGRRQGFDEIVVRVGPGLGRKQRFSGVLLAQWESSTNERTESYHVYRARSGRFVVHLERSEAHTDVGPDAAKWNTGWRAWVGDWSANQTWTWTPADSILHVADSLEELRDVLPAQLYDLVADIVDHPTIEDLDI
jgi:EXLDI family protein